MTDSNNDQNPGIRRWLWRTAIAYWMAMFVGTHIPLTVPPGVPEGSDKVVHFAGYALLAILFTLALVFSDVGIAKSAGIVLTCGAIYAVADELLQIPVNRHCDVHDMIADWLGLLTGCAVVFLFTGMRKKVIR